MTVGITNCEKANSITPETKIIFKQNGMYQTLYRVTITTLPVNIPFENVPLFDSSSGTFSTSKAVTVDTGEKLSLTLFGSNKFGSSYYYVYGITGKVSHKGKRNISIYNQAGMLVTMTITFV